MTMNSDTSGNTYFMAMAQDKPTKPSQPNRQPSKDDPGSAPESGDKMPEKQ